MGISSNWATTHFLSFETVMAPVGMSLLADVLQWSCTEAQGLVKVHSSATLDLVVQSLSRVRLLVTPWTEASQASLSFTISRSLFKLMSIEVSDRASPVAQTVKNLPAMQETQVQFLGSGRSPGEGNGNPLQYSHLENSMDRGAWQATVHGVRKSQT